MRTGPAAVEPGVRNGQARAGTQKQVVGGCHSCDNPPVVNGLHHPTGVYDNRSMNHLLPHKVLAARTSLVGGRLRPNLPVVLRTHDPRWHYNRYLPSWLAIVLYLSYRGKPRIPKGSWEKHLGSPGWNPFFSFFASSHSKTSMNRRQLQKIGVPPSCAAVAIESLQIAASQGLMSSSCLRALLTLATCRPPTPTPKEFIGLRSRSDAFSDSLSQDCDILVVHRVCWV